MCFRQIIQRINILCIKNDEICFIRVFVRSKTVGLIWYTILSERRIYLVFRSIIKSKTLDYGPPKKLIILTLQSLDKNWHNISKFNQAFINITLNSDIDVNLISNCLHERSYTFCSCGLALNIVIQKYRLCRLFWEE